MVSEVAIIDRIRIDLRTNGKSLPYKAVFPQAAYDWESYYPSGEFAQCTVDGTDMHLFRNPDDSQIGNLTHAEGILHSPKILLGETKKVRVAFDYGFSTNDLATRLQLLAAPVNHPDQYKVIAEFESQEVMTRVACDFDADAPDGEVCIGFGTNHEIAEEDQFDGDGYDVRVANVEVSDAQAVGVSTIATEGLYTVKGTYPEGAEGVSLVLYDLAGLRVASGRSISLDGLKGIYVLKVMSDGAESRRKIIL